MVKLASFFSGIGAFEKALGNLEIPYDLVCYCEIDKFASKSYSAIHGVPESMNLGDITKVDAQQLPKDIDLLTYGFPCQDISNAGKMQGLFNEDGSKTRSGLFFEALRIIKETKPKVCIAENVKNLTSKRFTNQFKIVLDSLEEAGYYNYWKVLNAKDFGVPQNRERVFIVSIRKDIDNGIFAFPDGFPLEKRLKDLLEEIVEQKYFLTDSAVTFVTNPTKTNKYTSIDGDVSMCLTGRYPYVTDDASPDRIEMLGLLDMKGNEQVRRVYGINGISPTLNTMQGGHRQPKVLVREATKKGYAEAVVGDSINLEHPNSKTRRGRVGKGLAQTLTTSCNQAVIPDSEMRIRKLTPKECFRLMGFDDDAFHRAQAVCSNAQLYKQAGNSIVVPVLEHLLQSLTGYWGETAVNHDSQTDSFLSSVEASH